MKITTIAVNGKKLRLLTSVHPTKMGEGKPCNHQINKNNDEEAIQPVHMIIMFQSNNSKTDLN